uniref:Suppressor protein SRP40-like n=1 Tax=Panagrellus redivivus TaxID=6233 RepID=A0A7E4VQU4_PANRE
MLPSSSSSRPCSSSSRVSSVSSIPSSMSSRPSSTSSKPSSSSVKKARKAKVTKSDSDSKKEANKTDSSVGDDFVFVDDAPDHNSDDSFDDLSASTAVETSTSTAIDISANTGIEWSYNTGIELSELSSSFTQRIADGTSEMDMYKSASESFDKENLDEPNSSDNMWAAPSSEYDSSFEVILCDDEGPSCGLCSKCLYLPRYSSTPKNKPANTSNASDKMPMAAYQSDGEDDKPTSSSLPNTSKASSTETAEPITDSFREAAENQNLAKYSLIQSIYPPELGQSNDENYLRVLNTREASIQRSPSPPAKVVRKASKSTQVEPKSTQETGMQTENISVDPSSELSSDSEEGSDSAEYESPCSGTCSCCTYDSDDSSEDSSEESGESGSSENETSDHRLDDYIL